MEKLTPIRFLEGIIADLKNRSQNQDEIGDSVELTKVAYKITQEKSLYLFEIAVQEHATIISRQ